MLTKIKPEDVPTQKKGKSEITLFAGKTLREFMDSSEVGDIAEITDVPTEGIRDPERLVKKVMSSLRNERFSMGLRDKVQPFQRKNRMFLKRIEA